MADEVGNPFLEEKYMKKRIFSLAVLIILVISLILITPGLAVAGGGGGGINNPPGNPLYVIIEVTWDGTLTDVDNDGNTDSSTWTVWGPKWAPVVGVGIPLSQATDCFDMSGYAFTFHGKTVHFDEEYVPTVDASPQVHHVVLKDSDGDGKYTGSSPACKYAEWRPYPEPNNLYHDRIDYEVSFDSSGNVTDFHYFQYEHKKLK